MTKIKITKADTFCKRFLGLMGKRTLSEGCALLLTPCNSIHMLFMRFAIDAIFLDKEMRIKKIVKNVQPWLGFAICLDAFAVLEVKAGEASRLQLSVGQCLKDFL